MLQHVSSALLRGHITDLELLSLILQALHTFSIFSFFSLVLTFRDMRTGEQLFLRDYEWKQESHSELQKATEHLMELYFLQLYVMRI